MTMINPWDEYIKSHPESHILQTPQWGELKSAFGWQSDYALTGEAGAQILFRPLPLGFNLAYLPKGPVGHPDKFFWSEVDRVCKSHRAVFLKVELDAWDDDHDVLPRHWIPSSHTIQPRRTILLDLSGTDEDVLARMKQKTRYNIRLAYKKDVVVRKSADIDAFSRLMEVTAERDEFGVHDADYYRKAYELFHPQGMCELFLAEFEHEPIAGVIVFARGQRAWYFYGASDNAHRNRMPNYLLQWEGIRWAKSLGCKVYDLWGIPDEDEAVLEQHFLDRSEGLWGVYRFKRGFGGMIRRAAPTYDRVFRPLLYTAYTIGLRLTRRGAE